MALLLYKRLYVDLDCYRVGIPQNELLSVNRPHRLERGEAVSSTFYVALVLAKTVHGRLMT